VETRDAEAQGAWPDGRSGSDGAWALGAVDSGPRRRRTEAVARRPEPFAALAPARSGRNLTWLCIQASLLAHALVGLALVLVPILAPEASPAPLQAAFAKVFLEPPPPPPPPLAARPVVPAVTKPVVPVLPDPRPDRLRIPDVFDAPPDPIGMPEGMEGGVEGGLVGGTPGGVVGGVIGGTGTGPVPEPDPDRPPSPVKLSKPRYPQEAFVKRIEGTVELEILIDALGRVIEARVTKSIPLLDAAAIETVREWRFTPAIKNGQPVAALARAPVTFRIH
jgi:protein TonB